MTVAILFQIIHAMGFYVAAMVLVRKLTLENEGMWLTLFIATLAGVLWPFFAVSISLHAIYRACCDDEKVT